MSFGYVRARVGLLPAAAALACALALSACQVDGPYSAKHLKPLPAETVALIERKQMTKGSPVLVRVFKEEAEMEIWKQDASGQFALLKTYPICRWSGQLGPKIKEGDRQAPEGFYTISPTMMNPNSSFYLSFNLGYPNAFDRAHGRTGAHLMVHGDCSSSGCYSMTDEQIAEIFALGREAFFAGQRGFQVQAFPFRMTALNMAKHRNSPHLAFWKNLKEGYDHFEVTRQQPKVDVCEKKYVFNGSESPNGAPLEYKALEKCPAYRVPEAIMSEVSAKARRDDQAFQDFVKKNTPTIALHRGRDGGMHPAFEKIYTSREVRDERGRLSVQVEKRPLAGPLDYRESTPEQVALASAPEATMQAEPVQSVETTSAGTASGVPFPRPAPKSAGRSQTAQAAPATSVRTSTVRSAVPVSAPPTAYAQPAPQSEGTTGFVSNLITNSRESVGKWFGGAAPAAPAPQQAQRPAPTRTGSTQPRREERAVAKKPEPAKKPDAKPQEVAKKPEPKKADAKPQQRTAAAGDQPQAPTLSGATPVVPAGSFESRFGAAGAR
ncbi:hypothetical protein GJW-30_1_01240 [Variibacter gotjawalensis]|uniref:L,D-TPase catalytic domain-containing protein n=1 Tax=Variibacter gotjawalensis TaxID=1333996 RepID=A0A0S3PS38_9BRAD|nr:L,D-transpeptidase family protein [Variibacter gotjawalensis]NIK49023.1 murein L,D-transpeptidase YafK [Variibacter gotjawalensis]RZS50879.1 murein L,D-transpeptidase YafK [Variibacter gotjawalensis]BAT58713.1 hypothetical protein GJW-30_1_01240 [Variibacter gotjawalensis]